MLFGQGDGVWGDKSVSTTLNLREHAKCPMLKSLTLMIKQEQKQKTNTHLYCSNSHKEVYLDHFGHNQVRGGQQYNPSHFRRFDWPQQPRTYWGRRNCHGISVCVPNCNCTCPMKLMEDSAVQPPKQWQKQLWQATFFSSFMQT